MSAPVSAIARKVQIGVETTRGTAVACSKRLTALGFRTRPKFDTDEFRPHGYLFPTMVVPGMEWTEGEIEGRACYNNLVYPLASLINYAAPVQIGATTGYTWTFAPNSSGPDTVKSFTLQEGIDGAGNAKQVPGLQVVELGMVMSRKAIEVSGAVMGVQTATGQTLTSSPTDIALKPILPKGLNVYIDDTAAALGTTQLLDDIGVTWKIGDRYKPWWPLNSSLPSYGNYVTAVPKTEIALRLANNAAGIALLTKLRNGDTQFIRVEAVGDNIGASADYTLTLDFAAKFTDWADEEEDDDALVIEPPMTLVHDVTWGKAMELVIVNTISAL